MTKTLRRTTSTVALTFALLGSGTLAASEIISSRDQSASQSMPRTSAIDPLGVYQSRSGIPHRIFLQLQEWRALPLWAIETATLRDDWLESLHSNVTREHWPEALRKATVRTLEGRGGVSPGISSRGPHKAIAIFDSTPVYLQELLEIVNLPLVPPATSDPHAKMLLSEQKKGEAANRLARVLGMLAETEFVDGLGSEWEGAAVFGTRFIYYHELGHLSLSLPETPKPSLSLYPIEEEFREEIAADQFAVSMLTLELRNHPELQGAAFTGMGLAMMLVASREYAGTDYGEGARKIKEATIRLARLSHWVQLGVELGAVDPAAPGLLQFYWDLYRELLRSVEVLPSPIVTLLAQTADRPPAEWNTARDHIVKWCAFGNCDKVGATLRSAHLRALEQSSDEPRALRVDRVVKYILAETSSLEPDLGLKAAMEAKR